MTLDQAVEQLSDEEAELLLSDEAMLKEFKVKFDQPEKEPEDLAVLGGVAKRLLPSKETLEAPLRASEKLGTMVKAGGSGLAELSKNVLPKVVNRMPAVTLAQSLGAPTFQEEPFSPALLQAGQNVNAVMQGLEPETPIGRAGEFAGSFFTPTQIALQATGAKAAPYIARGLGAIAKPIVKTAVNAFPRISELLGAAPQAITRLAENPQAVKAAKSMPQMADEVAGTVKGLSQKGMTTSAEGKKLLSAEKAVPGLKKSLNDLAMKIEGGPLAEETDRLAGKYVRDFSEKIEAGISEKEVGALIDTLDDKIGAKWAKANPTVITEAKEEVRRLLSHALQAQNKNYAKAMAESSATFEPTETLTKNLGLKSGAPSDTTISNLKKITSPDALSTQRALTNFPGLSTEVANAAAKAALQESLLGNLAMWGVPKLNPLVQGSVKATPSLANAIYEGLR